MAQEGANMALNQFLQHHSIKGTDIYVVDDHHKALAAWALTRRTLGDAPNLITIDHHTDTHEAFLRYAHWEREKMRAVDADSLQAQLVSQVDYDCDASVEAAVSKLKHDEHICAATGSRILGNAFCIQLSDSGGYQSVEEEAASKLRAQWPPQFVAQPVRPFTYLPAADRIYVISFDCYVGCDAGTHDDSCEITRAGQIIDAKYLDDQLGRGAEISRCIGLADLEAVPYILDIDLDAFHTRRAINPEDPSTLYRLIKNALAITIATEAGCVEELWLDDADRMCCEDLLSDLFAHFDKAL
jgi:hypothetical protein